MSDKDGSVPKAGAFLTAAFAGLSIVSGFAATMMLARKVDPSSFVKGFQPVVSEAAGRLVRNESGIRLATRAFGLATLLTVSTFGGVSFIVWHLSGARDMSELSTTLRSCFPDSWRVKPSGDGTNFKTFDELWRYINADAGTDSRR